MSSAETIFPPRVLRCRERFFENESLSYGLQLTGGWVRRCSVINTRSAARKKET